jgi:hypothetical protein
MGRSNLGQEDLPEDYSVGPLWLDYLSNRGYITELQFSTHFENFTGRSYIDFGPVQESGMSDPTETKTIECDEGFFYSAIPMGVRFGDYPSNMKFELKDAPAIFTTSMSLSFVPKKYSKLFFEKLIKGMKYTYEKNGVYYTECNSHPDDVFFLFQNRWIQVRGQDMVIDISD